VRKGTQLYIEGRIKTRSYDDQDGNKKYITEIVADQMQLLGRRSDEAGDQAGGQGGSLDQGGNMGSNQGAQPGRSSDTSSSREASAQDIHSDPDDPFGNGDNGPDDLPF